MNWYKKALYPGFKFPTVTLNTKMDVGIRLSIGEILAIDKFIEYGTHERIAREVLLKIIREHPEIIRMHTEGKI
jgi:hypothetical protein